ncbi:MULTISPECIES: hypothetical protein [Streptomyces]|uniref:Uncharacterized protein n=1 Tax=Streptomyces ramulosus TaxID=47762 RepID=A0ABW1FJG2_9ACTN
MVGLFWIDGAGCWLGAAPGEEAEGIRLTDEGPEVVGASGTALSWAQIQQVTVPNAPARSAFRRGLSTAIGLAAAMTGFGDFETPPLMTVCLTHDGGVSEHHVPTAASPAYTEREVALSHALLDRFVAGEASPSLLTEWWRSAGGCAALKPAEREALLEGWCGR